MSIAYDYYPAVLQAINEIGQGRTVTEACDRANIAIATFKSYVDRDPQLLAMFSEAEQRGYDALADALINIDNHKIHGHSDARMAKVVSDNIKWFLGKKRPKEYGERVQIEHNISVDLAITTALDAARRRVPQIADASNVVDAEIVGESDEEIMRQLLA